MSTPHSPAGDSNQPTWNPNAGAVPPIPPMPQLPPQPQAPQQQPTQQFPPQPTYAPQQYAQPGYAPQQPAYAPQQPGYAPQQPAFAPQQPAAYGLPPAPTFAAPHVNQPIGPGADALRAPLPNRSATPGKVAMLFGILAGFVTPLIALGTSIPLGLALKDFSAANGWPQSLHWLRPVATWELVTELTVYVGVLCGILAIVFAIAAISQDRGKRQGKLALIFTGIGVALMAGGLAATLLLPEAFG